MLSSIFYACLLLAALSVAFISGSKEERLIGLVFALGNAATIAVLFATNASSFAHVSVFYIGVDVVASMVLCLIAVTRPSWMTVLVAAFQINGALAHIVKLVAPDTISLSYAVLLRIWAWPMVATLLLAHWYKPLRNVLRQSDLEKLPVPLRPRTVRTLISRVSEYEGLKGD